MASAVVRRTPLGSPVASSQVAAAARRPLQRGGNVRGGVIRRTGVGGGGAVRGAVRGDRDGASAAPPPRRLARRSRRGGRVTSATWTLEVNGMDARPSSDGRVAGRRARMDALLSAEVADRFRSRERGSSGAIGRCGPATSVAATDVDQPRRRKGRAPRTGTRWLATGLAGAVVAEDGSSRFARLSSDRGHDHSRQATADGEVDGIGPAITGSPPSTSASGGPARGGTSVDRDRRGPRIQSWDCSRSSTLRTSCRRSFAASSDEVPEAPAWSCSVSTSTSSVSSSTSTRAATT